MSRRDMKSIARLGGLALVSKPAPAACERCGRSFEGKGWLSYLGHLGLHGLADRHFSGDVKAAQRRLQQNGLARLDPMPYNNAWPKYKPVRATDPAQRIAELEEDREYTLNMIRFAATETVRGAGRKSLILIDAELATLRGK